MCVGVIAHSHVSCLIRPEVRSPMLKRLLLIAADNKRLERLVSTNPRMRKLVSRFVAGTTLEEAIEVTKELNARGIDVSLDLLGETVEDLSESAVATEAYIEAVQAISRETPGATVSVKLSQLGIGLDPAVCAGHLKNLLDAADKAGVLVEVDMEHSSVGPPNPRGVPRGSASVPRHPGRHAGGDAAHTDGPRVVHRHQTADPAGQGSVPRDRGQSAAGPRRRHRSVPVPDRLGTGEPARPGVRHP